MEIANKERGIEENLKIREQEDEVDTAEKVVMRELGNSQLWYISFKKIILTESFILMDCFAV